MEKKCKKIWTLLHGLHCCVALLGTVQDDTDKSNRGFIKLQLKMITEVYLWLAQCLQPLANLAEFCT